MKEQALKDRIHSIAKEKSIPFNECWKQLLLIRFLARLSCSRYSENLIFKGGFLLSYMLEIGRETTDLDFLITKMTSSEQDIVEAIKEVASTALEDGFSFTYESIELLNQPHMDYPGYRVTLKTEFHRMNDKIQIDVGVGDVVKPEERGFHLFEYKGKPLFESEISLLSYPPETIFAEKLETIISKGSGNSRMKDYHDVILLSRSTGLIQKNNLDIAIRDTFQNRGTALELISFNKEEVKELQRLWTAHLKILGTNNTDLDLPDEMQAVITEINYYLVDMKLISI